MSSNAFVAGLSYISTIGIANHLGVEAFGEYSYILVIGLFFSQLVVFGSDETAIRRYLKNGSGITSSLLFFKITNFCLLAAAILLWVLWSGHDTLILALIVAAQGLSLNSAYEARGKNSTYARVYFFERLSFILLVWSQVWIFGEVSILKIVAALLISTVGSLIVQVWGHRSDLVEKKPTRSILPLWKDGVPLVMFSLSKYVYGGGTRVAIKIGIGYAALGGYSAAWQFVPIATLFLTQVAKIWRLGLTRAIHERNKSNFKALVARTCATILMPMALLGIAFFVLGSGLVNLIFSNEFSGALPLVPWISIYFVVIGFDVINSMLWVALGKVRAFSLIFCFFGSICALVLYLWRHEFGLIDFIKVAVAFHFMAVACSLAFLAPQLNRHFHSNP